MICVEFGFPAHRFHATPYGRHVNEGVAEWPPSPYRFLRALFDAWKRKHPEMAEEQVRNVLETLSAEPPEFALPAVTASHTRGYLSSNQEDPTAKSLIFDGFVALPPEGRAFMIWPGLTLGLAEQGTLSVLLGSLNYLGRSESWVDARLSEGAPGKKLYRCRPAAAQDERETTVPLACVVPAGEYDGKSWLDALTYSTAALLKDKRSSPPALRMVRYTCDPDAVRTRIARPPSRRGAPATAVTAVVVSLDGKVLPLVTATVEIAEQVRRKLMGIQGKHAEIPGVVSPRFSGKTVDGQPLSGHEHLFILPLGNDKGRIDRVLLYTRAKDGFNKSEVDAILLLRTLYTKNAAEPIRTVVTWKGQTADLPFLQKAQVAVSRTPFIMTRHWRPSRGDFSSFLAGEVRRECRNHCIQEPREVKILPGMPGLFEAIEYRRNRKDDDPRPGFPLRLTFAEPVTLPFSLGYGCHFGLGQFGPEENP